MMLHRTCLSSEEATVEGRYLVFSCSNLQQTTNVCIHMTIIDIKYQRGSTCKKHWNSMFFSFPNGSSNFLLTIEPCVLI